MSEQARLALLHPAMVGCVAVVKAAGGDAGLFERANDVVAGLAVIAGAVLRWRSDTALDSGGWYSVNDFTFC